MWLLSEKMAKKQIFCAFEDSRESILDKVKSGSDRKKLTFNTTCLNITCITIWLAFHNVRNILQEFHPILTPDQKHKRVFEDISVVGFHNGKTLKDMLVKTQLPKVQ